MGDHGERGESEVFWGEIAPCEHSVQLYEDESVLLDSLEGFVAGGLRAGDAVILIATPGHLSALEDRLRMHEQRSGFSISAARARDQYIALDAEETLSKFMVDGWPDETLFEREVSRLLRRARGAERPGAGARRVRAFGEMVAILWAQGHSGATVQLEHLWHSLCQAEAFSLFCAYPKIGFTQDAAASVQEICAAHSRLIAG